MTLRAFIIGLIVFILFIPSSLVFLLVKDRESRKDEVLKELNFHWGLSQTVTGPILSVPYKFYVKDEKDNKLIAHIQYAHFLPESLKINSTVEPQKRYRGIYEVIVYESTVNVEGYFNPPDFSGLGVAPTDVDWNGAFLSLGVSDMKGIRDFVSFKWNETPLSFNPGLKSTDLLKTGLSEHVPLEKSESYSFNFQLQLNGSTSLSFTPLGKVTTVAMQSPWTHPSFSGEFLPDNRQIDDKGFAATWKVLHLNRNLPQKWLGTDHSLSGADFGVGFFVPVDHYQKVMRSAKYAIMFLGLTFLALFIIEVLRQRLIHPLQYILVGLALIIFYTLLLSLAEHLPFGWAYLISSAVIIGMITGYVGGILSKGLAGYIGGILAILYLYLYIVLQLEDYALLIGSFGLTFVLAMVMYLTRKIDWYAIKSNR